MICVYDSKTTDFSNNGLVVLSDCESCFIEEKLNDSYELTLEYPLDSRNKWQYLQEGNIVKADGQLFRIYYKNKTITGVEINARHIFYDLLDNFIENLSITDNCSNVLNAILTNTQYTHNFSSFCTNTTTTKTFTFKEINPIAALLGDTGVISTFGMEISRKNFEIFVENSIGQDTGVLVSYGKNITSIEETIDMNNLCTRIYAKGKDGFLLPEKYVDSQIINNYYHPFVKSVEFNDVTTEADLRTAAQNYFTTSKCDYPLLNYKINFIELSKTEEYKNYKVLETINLGDTLIIRHRRLKIDVKCKVIRIKKNILTGRIEEIELGNFINNFAKTLTKIIPL